MLSSYYFYSDYAVDCVDQTKDQERWDWTLLCYDINSLFYYTNFINSRLMLSHSFFVELVKVFKPTQFSSLTFSSTSTKSKRLWPLYPPNWEATLLPFRVLFENCFLSLVTTLSSTVELRRKTPNKQDTKDNNLRYNLRMSFWV